MNATLDHADKVAGALRRSFAPKTLRRVAKQRAPVDPKAKAITFDDLWIRHKDPQVGVVNLGSSLNAVQQFYLDQIAPGWRQGDYTCRGLRELILKFRQPGFSTIIGALIFVNVYNTPHTRGVVLAQDIPASETLFEMHWLFYDRLPIEKKRPLKRGNKGELYFADINSRLYIGTAGRANLGRGSTVQFLHMSERAKWKLGGRRLQELDAGVIEAVPLDAGNVWKETTADGLGPFYDEYQKAKHRETAYKPRFFPWNMHKEYRLSVGAWEGMFGERFRRTEEEHKLALLYNLDDEQLAWRRVKKAELGDLFEQEYPLNDEECFRRSTDAAYYNTAYLMDLYAHLSKPENRALKVVDLAESFGYAGTLELYEYPEAGVSYVLGGDVAEGIQDDKDHDESVCEVFRDDTWEQVASYYGRPDPEEFGDIIDYVGRQFNDAWACIERNNHGLVTLTRLKNLAYPNLYHHKIERMKNGVREEEMQAGYYKSTASKVLVDDKLAVAINEAAKGLMAIRIKCRRAVGQLLRYVKLPNGKAAGDGSAHDDHNTSMGLANYLLTLGHRGPVEEVEEEPVILY